MRFTIEGRLPTLNEYIDAERSNRFIGAKIKKQATELVAWQVKAVPKIDYLADYHFTWYWPNKKSDPDNICYAKKFILDGLQEAGVLAGDSMRYVRSFSDSFEPGDCMVEVEVVKAS